MQIASSYGMKILALVLLIQGLHWVEHIAQVYQHWWLSLPIKESKGILFFLDLEWNHFVFNSVYLLLLVAVWFLIRKVSFRVAAWFLISGTLLQGYHVVEHIVRIWQHVQTACEPCKGILGWYIDGVYLHFAFNMFVLILPLAAFMLLIKRNNSYE